MNRTDQLLLEIRGAVDQLSRTAQAEQDSSRSAVARRLAASFSEVTDRGALRDAARDALTLFRGGMGSIQDVGTAQMASALERLHRALSQASRRW